MIWVFPVIIVLSLVVILVALLFVQSKPNWREKPRKRYLDLTKEFGRPDVLVPTKGGFAIWKQETLQKQGYPYHEITIKDEEIPYSCPKPHVDFLISSVCVDINNPEKLLAVLSISKSIWYDQLAHMLYARCHAMQANVATLVLATRMLLMLDEDLTKYWKNTSRVQGDYKDLIMGTTSNTYDKLTDELNSNLSKLSCTPPKASNLIDCSTLFDAQNFSCPGSEHSVEDFLDSPPPGRVFNGQVYWS